MFSMNLYVAIDSLNQVTHIQMGPQELLSIKQQMWSIDLMLSKKY